MTYDFLRCQKSDDEKPTTSDSSRVVLGILLGLSIIAIMLLLFFLIKKKPFLLQRFSAHTHSKLSPNPIETIEDLYSMAQETKSVNTNYVMASEVNCSTSKKTSEHTQERDFVEEADD
uniref:uncharacterized protein LOC120330770 n=1 Tax=Styela clava TaxID=7725 RepID=UPI00193A4384|nr:uncharacterized protein LOC120330770 [Styela clava]